MAKRVILNENFKFLTTEHEPRPQKVVKADGTVSGKVILNENCKCLIADPDLKPPVYDFINNLANCGTYLSDCEKYAFNEFYIDLTENTGVKTESIAFTGTDTKTLTISFADQTELTASFTDLQGVEMINGMVPDIAGNIILDADNVGAIDKDEKGQPNGVASLGSDGLVPTSQLPPIPFPNYPVTSVNGEVGDVILDATDVGAIANQSATAQNASFWIAQDGIARNFFVTGGIFSSTSANDICIVGRSISFSGQAGGNSISWNSGSGGYFNINQVGTGGINMVNPNNSIYFGNDFFWLRRNSDGKNIIDAQTTSGTITFNVPTIINGGALSLANLSTPPTGTNGSEYYDTALNKFRDYVNGAWQNRAYEGSAVVTGHTIYVDKDAPNATDTRAGISAYSQSVPFKTIGAALNAANLDTFDTIYIARGTYNESPILRGVNKTLMFDGCTINGDILQISDSYTFNFYCFLNGATLNGIFGVSSGIGAGIEIYGDGTGTIVTTNRIFRGYGLRIRNMLRVDFGNERIYTERGYGAEMENIKNVVGGWYSGQNTYMKNCSIDASLAAAAGRGFGVSSSGVTLTIKNSYVKNAIAVGGTPAVIIAVDSTFEYTDTSYNLTDLRYGSNFLRCKFKTTGQAINSPYGGKMIFEECGFEIIGGGAYALNLLTSGYDWNVIRCTANTTNVCNPIMTGTGNVGSGEQGSLVSSIYKVTY